MKCRQIANGGVFLGLTYTPALVSDQWQQLHYEKNEALVDLIDELGGKQLLIVYEFNHDLERIRESLKGRKVAYAADHSAKKFTEIEQAWNRGELTELVVQPQSVGHGLNLQYSSAQHICFYSQIWDLEVYEQVIQRILRQGNTAPHVTVHHIIARNTVDEMVVKGIRKKANVQNRLLAALKDYKEIREK
jgi:SNF2 family DNA or RNA helicase